MKQKLLEEILSDSKHLTIETCFSNKFPDIYKDLIGWNFPENFKFNQKLYHYIYDDKDLKLGICPVCGSRCDFNRFGKGYNKTCCIAHADILKAKNHTLEKKEEIKLKKQKTYLQKSDEEKERYSKSQRDIYKNKSDEEKKSLAEYHSLSMNNRSYEDKLRTSKLISNISREMWRMKSSEEIFKIRQAAKETEIKQYKQKYNINNLTDDEVWSLCIKDYHTPKGRNMIVYDNICFDSSWEVIFYKYHKSLNHNIIYHPNNFITYIYNGVKHTYQPDFLIDNQLYEIKGDHFFDGDQMIDPFDNSKNELYEAKHQCMIDNNVKIIRKEDIKKMRVI